MMCFKTIFWGIFLLRTAYPVFCFDFVEIPVQFITKDRVNTEPREIKIFNLRTCGGDHFNHHQLNVSVNLPNKRWRPYIGDFVYINISSSFTGDVIATNDVNGTRVAHFTFTYYAYYGDLIFSVRTANTPFLIYTLTARFERPVNQQRVIPTRFVSTLHEMMLWKRTLKKFSNEETGTDLIPVSTSKYKYVIKTFDHIAMEIYYCFTPTEFPGAVFVTVSGLDEISAFVTYVCTGSVKFCNTTEAANYYDISGSNVNFIPVKLKTDYDKGPIKIIVKGFGQHNADNTFVLLVSRFTNLSSGRKTSQNSTQSGADQTLTNTCLATTSTNNEEETVEKTVNNTCKRDVTCIFGVKKDSWQ